MMVAASAWVGEVPSRGMSYDGSALTFTPPKEWGPNDIEQFRKRLQVSGYAVDQGGDGQITLRKAKRG
jgi:hypothetical protein